MKLFLLSVTILLLINECFGVEYTQGERENGDRLLYHDIIEKPAHSDPQKTVSKTIFYTSPQVVTFVKVEDRNTTLTFGIVYIDGVGKLYMKIILVSGKGRGLNYDIEIYGK